jgi:GNAT superfamily N-acetyltransferase
MVTNMIVELGDSSFDAAREADVLSKTGLKLLQHQGASDEEVAWIRRTFNRRWAKEALHGWNWFAKNEAGKTLGFACYDQRALRFWWLKNWLDQPDVGIFGPMGVDAAERGHGLGCILTRRALASLHELGYVRAVIPRVGPVQFYERCCGAQVAERLRFLGLF